MKLLRTLAFGSVVGLIAVAGAAHHNANNPTAQPAPAAFAPDTLPIPPCDAKNPFYPNC